MFKASFSKYTLQFKRPAGTSRGTLTEKESYFVSIEEDGVMGIGECSYIKGLSCDKFDIYEATLNDCCKTIDGVKNKSEIDSLIKNLTDFPSIQFGLETALLDLQNGGKRIIYDSAFSRSEGSIPINGLIWMGSADYMEKQVAEKIADGFNCIKMKIGAIDFDSELDIIRKIREKFANHQLTLRVDANGAFTVEECMDKLESLAAFNLHSIEQPIAFGQWEEMARICASTPLAVALDEELIGIKNLADKENLLDKVKPQYIILKPSLMGGIAGCKEWINLADARNIGWWITSALESNIGLNAIAQWTYTLQNRLHQGLGTGQLFTNNIPSPLKIEHGMLRMDSSARWETDNTK